MSGLKYYHCDVIKLCFTNPSSEKDKQICVKSVKLLMGVKPELAPVLRYFEIWNFIHQNMRTLQSEIKICYFGFNSGNGSPLAMS